MIHDFKTQDTKFQKEPHENMQIPIREQNRVQSRALSDILIKKIFNLVFSYIYWLFTCVYFFEYKEKLSLEYEKGLKIFLKSKAFWDFNSDLMIAVFGYFLLMSVLNFLLFKKLFCKMC